MFLLLLFLTINTAAAICTPTSDANLKIAVDACLLETPDGSCPLFKDLDTDECGKTGNNGLISTWDTTAITSMFQLFSGAATFNADISGWTTNAVTTMQSMFSGAKVFNRDISGWTGTAATTVQTDIFKEANAFQIKYICTDTITGPVNSCSLSPLCINTDGLDTNTPNCVCGLYKCKTPKLRCFTCSSICFATIDDAGYNDDITTIGTISSNSDWKDYIFNSRL